MSEVQHPSRNKRMVLGGIPNRLKMIQALSLCTWG
jgi:hypothetical protein